MQLVVKLWVSVERRGRIGERNKPSADTRSRQIEISSRGPNFQASIPSSMSPPPLASFLCLLLVKRQQRFGKSVLISYSSWRRLCSAPASARHSSSLISCSSLLLRLQRWLI